VTLCTRLVVSPGYSVFDFDTHLLASCSLPSTHLLVRVRELHPKHKSRDFSQLASRLHPYPGFRADSPMKGGFIRPRHCVMLRRWATVPSLQGCGSERLPAPSSIAKSMIGWWNVSSLFLSTSSPTFRCIGTTKDSTRVISAATSAATCKKKEPNTPPSKAGGSKNTSSNVGSSSDGSKKSRKSSSLQDENPNRLASPPVESTPTRDLPRTIVVAKDSAKTGTIQNDGKSSTTDKGDKQPPLGFLKRRFPLEREITDSTGKVIWIPAKAVIEKGSVVATQLPQIHATAWLDPSMYCRDGGTSIAGTEAARKLLRGKRDLMELLGYAVHNSSSSKYLTTIATERDDSVPPSLKREPQRSYVLQGHGVPHQMLQHHVDFAASLLYRLDAAEVSFKQFNVTQHHNSSAASDAVRELQRTYIRDAETGGNKVLPWPLDDGEHWKDDLQLYWTAMNRIATRLGLAVLLKRPRDATLQLAADQTIHTPSNSLLKTPPHHWKVEFTREWQFAPQQLPPGKSPLFPILEWAPMDGIATTPGHVCIWLQGVSTAKYNGSALRVSLCFDACFRRNLSSSYGVPMKQ
jgi:hypothetical protein